MALFSIRLQNITENKLQENGTCPLNEINMTTAHRTVTAQIIKSFTRDIQRKRNVLRNKLSTKKTNIKQKYPNFFITLNRRQEWFILSTN